MPPSRPTPGRAAHLAARARRAAQAAVPAARRAWGPARTGVADEATVDDVVNCYRLLLGRQPDPGGLAHYVERLRAGPMTVAQLSEEFLTSVEFARARAQRSRAVPARQGPVSERVTTVEGLVMHVDPSDFAVGHTVARTGSYEPDVSAALRARLRPGATFVDVGANIGWFSILAASLVGPTGRVVAVEPNPDNVALLLRSAQENGFDNIDAHCVALAEEPGAVALETDGSNGRVIPVDGPPPAPVRASYVVAAHPLDELLERGGTSHVDVMKIDVEGAEPMAVRGARRMLQRDHPVLVSEFYPLALDSAPWGSAQGYLDLLRSLGYRLQVIGVGGDQPDAAIFELACAPGQDHVDLLALPG